MVCTLSSVILWIYSPHFCLMAFDSLSMSHQIKNAYNIMR